MDIGAKIRDARVKSGLTQEQAAEALSCQQTDDLELGNRKNVS